MGKGNNKYQGFGFRCIDRGTQSTGLKKKHIFRPNLPPNDYARSSMMKKFSLLKIQNHNLIYVILLLECEHYFANPSQLKIIGINGNIRH